MSYTLLKGKTKVEAEYKIVAITYNLNRLMSILGLKELKKRLRGLFCSLFEFFSHIRLYKTSCLIIETNCIYLSRNTGDNTAADERGF